MTGVLKHQGIRMFGAYLDFKHKKNSSKSISIEPEAREEERHTHSGRCKNYGQVGSAQTLVLSRAKVTAG